MTELKKQPTILIVEDDKNDFTLLKEILKKEYPDATLLHTTSIYESYKLKKQRNYDVVILDLNLPDAYGAGSVSEIKNYLGEKPIIVVSGIINDIIEKNAKKNGAKALFAKDEINGPELKAVIDSILF